MLTVILLEYIFYLLYLWEYGILYDLNPLKCSERLTWEPMMNIYAPLAKMLQYKACPFCRPVRAICFSPLFRQFPYEFLLECLAGNK